MDWSAIEQRFRSPKTLTVISMAGLPTAKKAMGTMRETSLLGLAFGSHVAVGVEPNADLLNYYSTLGVGPTSVELLLDSEILAKHPFPSPYQEIAELCPSDSTRAVVDAWKGRHAFSHCNQRVFSQVLSRKFLLLECPTIATIPALSIETAKAMGGQAVFSQLNRFGSGVWVRNFFSVHGDAIGACRNLAELEICLQTNETQRLIVPCIPREIVSGDLEVSFSLEAGKTTLLGVVEQSIERNRHVGSRDVVLGPEIFSQVQQTVQKLGKRLTEIGFHSGILGLDGFILQENGQACYRVYDLNPCVSQGFFPLYVKKRLERRFGALAHFRIHMYSIFPEIELGQLNPHLLREEARGLFPILFHSNRTEGSAFGRTTLMALFVSDDLADIGQRIAKFEDTLAAQNRISYKMHF